MNQGGLCCKIITILILLLISTSGYGQIRYVDVTPRIVYPDSGHYFISPGEDSVVYYLINHGPDTLFGSDMYWCRIQIANVYPDPPIITNVGSIIAPNDSLLITHALDLDYYNHRPQMDFCITLSIWSNTGSFIYNEKDTGDWFLDNETCILAAHDRISSTWDIFYDVFKIYPNPAENVVYIQGIRKESIEAVNIFNHQGKLIKSDKLYNNAKDHAELDIANLVGGTYILQVISNDGVSYKKLIKL